MLIKKEANAGLPFEINLPVFPALKPWFVIILPFYQKLELPHFNGNSVIFVSLYILIK